MTVYHIRPKPHGINRESDFLKGRVSIGWPCGQDLRGLSRDELQQALAQEYPEINAHNLSQVEQFLHIEVGSIVLSPSESNVESMHLFRTVESPQYDMNRDNSKEGNPHGVAVEHIMTVKKSLLPPGVLRSLKGARKTVCNFSKHASAMDEFLEVAEHLSEEPVTAEFELQNKVRNTLIQALDSENEVVRVQAAAALYQSA
ncbi:hypothetical protein FOB89_08820 [Shewanella putrefaciens]|uniref:Uncharacterized protein n=1 Tax=Shewanella putrefaciens (strain CN-32 / ATCC BAA-453) TaxID=319224 RepID=A4Y9H5_SHEPC|nr:hypothetical protein FOB89_08820 [Shewanella putrefaciens]